MMNANSTIDLDQRGGPQGPNQSALDARSGAGVRLIPRARPRQRDLDRDHHRARQADRDGGAYRGIGARLHSAPAPCRKPGPGEGD